MDGAAFWVMKYSQVSDSLRNDGGPSVPFQGVIFFPVTACFVLTVISMGEGLDRRHLSALRAHGRCVLGAWRGGPGPGLDALVGWSMRSPGRGCGGLPRPPGSCQLASFLDRAAVPPGHYHLKGVAPRPPGELFLCPSHPRPVTSDPRARATGTGHFENFRSDFGV